MNDQGTEPFIAAADGYLGWLNAAMVRLYAAGHGDAEVAATVPDFSTLLDMDSTLAANGGGELDDIEARRITVGTHDGKVTLSGSVASWSESDEAVSAAWAAPGVTSVHNDLMISP